MRKTKIRLNSLIFLRYFSVFLNNIVLLVLCLNGFKWCINGVEMKILIVEDDNKEMMYEYTHGRHTTYKAVKSFDEVKLGNVSKLLAIIYDENEMIKLRDEMQKRFDGILAIVRSNKYYLEFTNINATKGSALEFLKEYWGIKKEEVMASGDQDNDFEMLEGAGIKIAMGNASPKLKEIADFICPPIQEDGLSRAIEKYILCE